MGTGEQIGIVPQILTVTNQKGGVGKTTTTFHLARAAIKRGLKVLLVDLDPQGNLTSSAAAEPVSEDQEGLADVLSSRVDTKIRDVIVPGVWENLDLVPTSGESLGYVRDELVIAGAGRERRLRDALTPVAGDYDLVLIDCAPSLDQLTINGLTAATGTVVVTQSKLYSANGLAKLLETIANVQECYNPDLKIAGVIVNQHEAGTTSGRTWVEEIGSALATRRIPMFEDVVPKRVVVADACEAGKGLDEWGSSDATALAGIYDTYVSSLMGGKR